jgi:hypothetical protein
MKKAFLTIVLILATVVATLAFTKMTETAEECKSVNTGGSFDLNVDGVEAAVQEAIDSAKAEADAIMQEAIDYKEEVISSAKSEADAIMQEAIDYKNSVETEIKATIQESKDIKDSIINDIEEDVETFNSIYKSFKGDQ